MKTLAIGDVFLYITPDNSFEGYSNVISEAEASGLPIIAEKKGGNIEQITDKNGYLCSDWSEIKSSLEKLIMNKSLRNSMGEASRALVKKRGGIEALGSSYTKIYEKELKRL